MGRRRKPTDLVGDDPQRLVPVTVRFTVEQVHEIDLRADAFQLDRADVIRMETLKGIGWVERKRAEQEKMQRKPKDA